MKTNIGKLNYLPDGKYFSIKEVLKLGKKINLVLGMRGFGKTYSWKKMVIENFLEKGEEFGYARRYKSELKRKSMLRFFDDVIEDHFPGLDIKWDGEICYCNKQIIGQSFTLAASSGDRGVGSYPRMTQVLFDEFLIDRSTSKLTYLPDDVGAFLHMEENIARRRKNIQFTLCANVVSHVSDYFDHYNVRLDPNKNEELILRDNMLVIKAYSAEMVEEQKRQYIAEGGIDSAFAAANLFNRPANETAVNIVKKTGNARLISAITFNGRTIGVWKDGGAYVISRNAKGAKSNFTMDIYNVSKEEKFIARRHPLTKRLIESFSVGRVFFDSKEAKNDFNIFMKNI